MTQNIDDLHERAGSRNLLHMHGELLRARCARCGATSALDRGAGDHDCLRRLRTGRADAGRTWCGSARCRCDMARIGAALARCGLFVAIGTSGNVYPAAGFVAELRGRARTVELNLEPSDGAALFDEAHRGPATRVVPEFVAGLLAQWDGDD